MLENQKVFLPFEHENIVKRILYLYKEELSCLQCLEKDSIGDHMFGGCECVGL